MHTLQRDASFVFSDHTRSASDQQQIALHLVVLHLSLPARVGNRNKHTRLRQDRFSCCGPVTTSDQWPHQSKAPHVGCSLLLTSVLIAQKKHLPLHTFEYRLPNHYSQTWLLPLHNLDNHTLPVHTFITIYLLQCPRTTPAYLTIRIIHLHFAHQIVSSVITSLTTSDHTSLTQSSCHLVQIIFLHSTYYLLHEIMLPS